MMTFNGSCCRSHCKGPSCSITVPTYVNNTFIVGVENNASAPETYNFTLSYTLRPNGSAGLPYLISFLLCYPDSKQHTAVWSTILMWLLVMHQDSCRPSLGCLIEQPWCWHEVPPSMWTPPFFTSPPTYDACRSTIIPDARNNHPRVSHTQ